MSHLRRGDLLPRVLCPPPGPVSRRWSRRSIRHEAPGINAIGPDGKTLFWQEARGANIVDVDGNRFIDLTSGFGAAAVGHRHPAVVAAVRAQVGILVHGLGDVHSHPVRIELARQLTRIAPVDEGQVFFATSGSDAVEIALKTALLATDRQRILVFDPAYHGLSLGVLPLSSRPEFQRPFADWFRDRFDRLPYACSGAEIDRLLRRRKTACVLVEPIVGREGIIPPPSGWLGEIRQLCRRHGTWLAADEVFTGLGRSGRWFAVEHDGVRPDLLCCGKALGGGLPIAAVVGERSLMSFWKRDGEALHTGTFVANPVACAAAVAALGVLRSKRLPDRAARLGRQIETRLRSWQSDHESISAIRGRGLMWGVELVDSHTAHRLGRKLLARGVIALIGGPRGRVLQLLPPLVISDRQLRAALDIVESALGDLAR